MIARNPLFAATLLAVTFSAGCSYNPGTFPYWLPGGHIVQDHAKPSGPGYFRNFDPKAVKLEVTPNQNVNAPLGASIVLVATVVDKDGQPRRSRRVEWVLEGPGNIIEVDESGFYPGRGYKVDNKYAVSYTNYFTKTITRGNNDPGDDAIIAPGQTFCVISSAVPGETVVTAYAPEVFNWDNGRVVVKVLWGESRFSFPAPTVVRSGGECTLTTSIAATGSDPLPTGYRVRYRVIDGPPAVLVARSGAGTATSQSGTGEKEAESLIDSSGQAAVQLVQRAPKAGKTRVAIEIIKPSENGAAAGAVVARKETAVEWAEPQLHLAVKAPRVAALNGTFPVTVSLENDGAADSRDSQVKVTLSDGATMASSEPPPLRQDANGTLQFNLSAVPGKARQSVVMQVKPARLGSVAITADASTSDGMQATNTGNTTIDQGRLQLVIEAPPAALAGPPIPFKIAITNGGAAPAEHATVWAQYDAGLVNSSPQNPVELNAGTIAPGQTKTLNLPLTARSTGRYAVKANATADGELSAKADPVTVTVQRAELAATVSGPSIVYLNNDFEWALNVSNPADTTVSDITVRAAIPPEVLVKTASDGGKIGPGAVEWRLTELKPREQKSFKVSVGTLKLTDRAVLSMAALGDVLAAGKTVGDPVGVKAESVVAIIGTPAIVLEVTPPSAQLEVGKQATFIVQIKNQGTVSARNIELAAYASLELKTVRGTGPTKGQIDAAGKIVFPAVDELQPGATLTFKVDVQGAQSGDARFRAEVKAAHLRKVIEEEQSTRVTAR
jgi:hypothetical protein